MVIHKNFRKRLMLMSINEERVKEFFSNEENRKKIAQDQDFMNKVLEVTTILETHINEFKKFGFNLS